MNFLQKFTENGYFYQATNIEELSKIMDSGKKLVAYIGFDCTAKSLHVGNLMQIMILRLFQQYGHKPVVIVGGATTKIGDPTGKDEARKIMSDNEFAENIAGIKKSLSKFIKFGDGENDAIMLNNADWLESIKYMDFLRDYGRIFSVNRMLSMDSVKSRLDRQQPLTFLEFNYMLLQAYDFYHLNQKYNCMIQFGGSDQWGNIVMGTDLVRKLTGNEVFAITTPLLTTSSGSKMGKSVSGAIWINEEQLSPYDYYQYWRNCEDPDILKFAKLYAEFDNIELEKFKELINKNINEAKKLLAFTLTSLCHGEENALKASNIAKSIFEDGLIDENLPTIFLKKDILNSPLAAYQLFFETQLADSNSEARKLIRGGGARINDQKIDDENLAINEEFFKDGLIKLSAGRKKHILVKISKD